MERDSKIVSTSISIPGGDGLASSGPRLRLAHSRSNSRLQTPYSSSFALPNEHVSDIESQKNLSNIYASPSLLITGRSSSAPGLIRAISKDRMLVESDSHDVRLCPKLVWGAVEWIGRCKGWRVEWLNAEEEEPWEMSEAADEEGEEEIVRILGRNWAQFMRLIE